MKVAKILFRLALYFAFFWCLLLYAFFQGSEYDWMEPQYRPAISAENSGNREVFRGLLVFFAVILQVVIAFFFSRKEAISTVVLFGLIIVFFR
ncbi:hypothetical protein A584_15983 [Pseudomonas syringae pv. theae ICMP 3923]|uniref:hypothetical protein n=1 Tax=Pseudomonas syringae TaxID=317 RepID=UPI00035786C4|nr:hypothetical protein [Pseudomonas syringae]EPM68819.1 hypothetical protein A584_15983 [Pseudomonas syringae pv. theae ICMP 3923]MBL3831189.1 hypothetical protein [Pseudomonas syringae pv. theae]MBL3836206.1 hypothetical protein [Pseudomonas syringae pv. theae]MBL3870204.1 hypothetical protein [Pseudomonas syringae pv. theae]MBL3872183.1 hypothetical protein [Pseudomonas syringae pv. theae]